MSGIRISGVRKEFAGKVRALDNIDLEIRDGEFTVLVGPSGCGKSTLLRIIAGLDEATEGTVHIGDREVTDLPPGDRDVAMVFQNYALYPHMTVRENMRFGLEVRKAAPRAEIERRTEEAAEILGLTEYMDRRPRQLSGGQRQRVAMGRAIVRRPLAFLMDEPLSNLDAKLRVSMRAELAQLRTRVPTTTVYVTHDQVEAMTLGDRVAVLRDGVLQQYGTPEEVFEHPANVFVATFIGSPSMNVVPARVSGGQAHAGGLTIALPQDTARPLEGRDLILGVRPSDLMDDRGADPALPRIEVTCDVVEYLGTEANILFTLDVPTVGDVYIADDQDEALPQAEGSTQFVARLARRTTAHTGDRIRLAVDVDRLYFFDAHTHATVHTPQASAPASAVPADVTQ